jgi:hypothetical protein
MLEDNGGNKKIIHIDGHGHVLGGIVPIPNEVTVRHANTHAICSILAS